MAARRAMEGHPFRPELGGYMTQGLYSQYRLGGTDIHTLTRNSSTTAVGDGCPVGLQGCPFCLKGLILKGTSTPGHRPEAPKSGGGGGGPGGQKYRLPRGRTRHANYPT